MLITEFSIFPEIGNLLDVIVQKIPITERNVFVQRPRSNF